MTNTKTIRITCSKGDLSVDFELTVPELEGTEKQTQLAEAEDIRYGALLNTTRTLLEYANEYVKKAGKSGLDKYLESHNLKTLEDYVKTNIETEYEQCCTYNSAHGYAYIRDWLCDWYRERSAKTIIKEGKHLYTRSGKIGTY